MPGDTDVAVAGGATTVERCLAAGRIDELRLHVTPSTVAPAPASSTASHP